MTTTESVLLKRCLNENGAIRSLLGSATPEPSKSLLERLQIPRNVFIELHCAGVVLFRNELEMCPWLGNAHWSDRLDRLRIKHDPVLALTDTGVEEISTTTLSVVLAHLAILRGICSTAIVDDLLIFRVSIPSRRLLVLDLFLDEVHLIASILDLILSHRGVLHSNLHQ